MRFLGSVPRETVLRLFRAADASVLPSAWENFPHTVVEALAVGWPVIATAVGGVPEVVRDGENGLLVPPGDAAALAAAIERFFGDAPCASACAAPRAIGRGLLGGGRLHGDRGGAPEGGRVKKRLLMVGRSRYSLPLSPSLAQKFDALSAELDVRVLASSGGGHGTDPRFRLVRPIRPRALDGAAFYALLPFRVARELRSFRPDAVLAQGAQEAALCVLGRTLARVPTRVIADIHGDRRRRHGSTARRGAGARAARRRARPPWAAHERRRADDLGVHVRARARARCRADGRVRRVHGSRAVRRARARRRCPKRPSLSSSACSSATRRSTCSPTRGAWPRRASRTRRSTSSGAGRSATCREQLVADLPAQTRWTESLSTPEVARALDEATVLVLPSRSEGLGRVVVEAFCRGRGVVGSRVGGIPDIVEDGETGMLVQPGDAPALADALVRVLSIVRSPSGSARPRTPPCSRGSRRRRSTPAASASSWTTSPDSPPTLTRCARTGRSSS